MYAYTYVYSSYTMDMYIYRVHSNGKRKKEIKKVYSFNYLLCLIFFKEICSYLYF